MRTELWDQFGALAGAPPRVLATVTAHNSDGTSSVTTFEGAETRVLGQVGGTIPYNVWIADGRAVDRGPNLPLVTGSV